MGPLRGAFLFLSRKIHILNRVSISFGLTLFGLLLVTAYLYSMGGARGFEFDDFHNLGGLNEVTNLSSAIQFALSGSAGPLGRPLSLLTFSISAYAWPDWFEEFLRINIGIHLINGLLVLLISYKLAVEYIKSLPHPEFFALAIGAIWMLHPLLASASLMVVQRMTTLSAMFVFLGVLTYIYANVRMKVGSMNYMLTCGLGVVFFTLCAALSKENGLLLPLLLLVLDKTIMNRQKVGSSIAYRFWRVGIFYLPGLALMAYMLSFDYANAYYPRNFTLSERLLTESRILVQYLALILFPNRAFLGPYQDDFQVSTGLFQPLSTFASVLGIILGIAFAVARRRQNPVLSFGILWFFVAHIIESSVFPLEMYFEHRNYVASVGVIFVFVYLVFSVREPLNKFALSALAVYVVAVGFVLLTLTSLWGDRDLSAEVWQKFHPGSERAAQALAQSYVRRGQVNDALKVVEHIADINPENIGVQLQLAQVACGVDGDNPYLDRLDSQQGQRLFRAGMPSSMVCDTTEKLTQMAILGGCNGLEVERVRSIMSDLLLNPRVATNSDYRFCLSRSMAETYMSEGNLDQTMKYLQVAFEARPFIGMGLQLMWLPASAGLYDAALENAEFVLTKAPKNSILKKEWVLLVEELKEKIMSEKSRVQNKQR
jgi:protein O-mannosyl-transferase